MNSENLLVVSPIDNKWVIPLNPKLLKCSVKYNPFSNHFTLCNATINAKLSTIVEDKKKKPSFIWLTYGLLKAVKITQCINCIMIGFHTAFHANRPFLSFYKN